MLTQNSSGTGKFAEVPFEIRGWNWGAFLLSWIWGLANNSYIALLCLIPVVNIVMIFVLGANGSKWAWQNKKWDSIEHFKRVQKNWAVAGFIILGLTIIIWLA